MIILLGMACVSQGTSPTLEERAQEIDRSLICPVCPGETVDQAQAELAKQMRAIVREKLVNGESRQDILDFFVERYGADVLAAPPKSGFNLVAWGIPVLGVLMAAAALVLILRRMPRSPERADEAEQTVTVGAGLEPYLDRVDGELERILRGDGGVQDETSPSARQT